MRDIPGVQEYDIKSEGSLEPWLRLIVADGKISHYVSGPSRLELYWRHDGDAQPFLGTHLDPRGRWVGPTVEVVAQNIESWLAGVDYGEAPDTDGEVSKGWRLTNSNEYGYVEFVVTPHWQVYGK